MQSGNVNQAVKRRVDELLFLIVRQRKRLFTLCERVENLRVAAKSSAPSLKSQRSATLELNAQGTLVAGATTPVSD
jgi:hypothetical protein